MSIALTFEQYYWEVTQHAIGLGYTPAIVVIFKSNIEDYYHNGKSVEECISEVF